MKGDSLSSTIFNIVVEVVIPLWDTVVAVEEEVLQGFVRAVQTLYALSYEDDGILSSPTPARLQAALDVLTGLLYRVGIQFVFVNMVGMTCLPCLTSMRLSEVSYTQSMNGVGPQTWVMTPGMVQTLGVPSLCDLAPQKESPKTPHGRSVVYTMLEDSLREAKLQEGTVFITWQQNTVSRYIAMRKVMEL